MFLGPAGGESPMTTSPKVSNAYCCYFRHFPGVAFPSHTLGVMNIRGFPGMAPTTIVLAWQSEAESIFNIWRSWAFQNTSNNIITLLYLNSAPCPPTIFYCTSKKGETPLTVWHGLAPYPHLPSHKLYLFRSHGFFSWHSYWPYLP